jgi:hypothetical protein
LPQRRSNVDLPCAFTIIADTASTPMSWVTSRALLAGYN